jgi:enoyl-CoA hydratase
MSEVMIERPYEGVALVRMCAPERKNAFTGATARALRDALQAVDADPGIGALVLTGTTDAFCAGAHRDLLAAVGRGEPQAVSDIEVVYDIFEVMRNSRVPIIAAVCGSAVGAGLNLVLAADVRVVADDAYLRSMFVANSIHPGGAHLQMLDRMGGREAVTLMAVLDEPLSGAEFARRGWAAEALPAEEVEARALALARRAGRAPELARLIKQSSRATADLSAVEAADYEGRQQRTTLTARFAV